MHLAAGHGAISPVAPPLNPALQVSRPGFRSAFEFKLVKIFRAEFGPSYKTIA